MSTEKVKMMDHAVAWFEVSATKLERAQKFYENIFGVEMVNMEMDDSMKMAMFPIEEGGVGGAICGHADFYHPGYEGPLVYFNANPDFEMVLNQVEKSGGKIIQPKTQITEEYGYMAVFEDTEGNRVALHSMS